MLFNSPQFIIFFLLFFIVFHFITRKNDHKLVLIAVGSLFFYGCFNWRFVPILLATGLVDFFIAAAIGKSSDEKYRNQLLIFGVVMNVGVLCFFKYTNFFLANIYGGLHVIGIDRQTPVLNI